MWKANGKEWTRTTFASKFSHNTACIAKKERPIALILKNSHYTYLAPPAQTGAPHTWMTDSTNKLIIDLTGNGRHTPASSSRTPSVRTYQGHKSTSTPSVHTCAHAAKQQPTSLSPGKYDLTANAPSVHMPVPMSTCRKCSWPMSVDLWCPASSPRCACWLPLQPSDRPAQTNSNTQQHSPSSMHTCSIGLRHRLTGKQQPPTANKPTEELI